MPQKKHDYVALFPHPEAMLRTMRSAAPAFMRCPNGHDLPHRVSWGRCSPADCCDYGQPNTRSTGKGAGFEGERKRLANTVPYKDEMDMLPMGLESMAVDEKGIDLSEAAYTQERAKEAVRIMSALGQNAALEAAHPLPELPPPPDLKALGPQQYVKQRLEDISPYLLEMKIAELKFAGSQKTRSELLADLMDRAGHGRKPDNVVNVTAPVMFVQGFQSPYERQKTLGTEQGDVQRSIDGNEAERLRLAAERGHKLLAERGFEVEQPGSPDGVHGE